MTLISRTGADNVSVWGEVVLFAAAFVAPFAAFSSNLSS